MKEAIFLTEIVNSFKDHDCYAFKIPDMPTSMMFRFNPDKACDIVVGYGRGFLGVEGKMSKKFEAFGMRHVRESQQGHLDDMVRTNNEAYIFLNVRISGDKTKGVKRENRLIMFPWAEFKIHEEEFGSYKQKEIMAMPYVKGSKKRFDLTEFLKALK